VLNDRIGEPLDNYIFAEHRYAQMADGSRKLAQMMEQAERILIRAEIRDLGAIFAFTGPHQPTLSVEGEVKLPPFTAVLQQLDKAQAVMALGMHVALLRYYLLTQAALQHQLGFQLYHLADPVSAQGLHTHRLAAQN
jgi:hypothetical protein